MLKDQVTKEVSGVQLLSVSYILEIGIQIPNSYNFKEQKVQEKEP
jgi:hypothetical protein